MWTSYFPLKVSMFGEFTIKAGDLIIDNQINNSKKITSLLSFLLLSAGKSTSIYELFETIWPESEQDTPANGLKTLLYRLRMVFKNCHLPFYKEIILVRNGTYRFNPEIPCEIDALNFEQSCNTLFSNSTMPKEKETLLKHVISLYKGEFLPICSTEEWVIRQNLYYKSLYLKCIYALIDILKEQKNNPAITEYCRLALIHEPFDEHIHYHLILSLINQARYAEAKKQYKYVSQQFYNTMGVTPSESFQLLYQKILNSEKHKNTNLSFITKNLNEHNHISGAFFCDYGIFKYIYQLQARLASRYDSSAFLVLITLSTKSNPKNVNLISIAMEQFLITLQTCLRKNDVVTRYSRSQVLLILCSKKEHNCRLVIGRVLDQFKKIYPNHNIQAAYSIEEIKPFINNNVQSI